MRKTVALLLGLLLSPALVSGARDGGDFYDESAVEDNDYKSTPGSEWKEQELVLPPYPDDDDLIRIDVGRYDFAYEVFVDAASLSVGEDRILRYTVVLRSRSGVDNVSFEGIRCGLGQYKRYAYGTGGRFYPLPDSDWTFIRSQRQDVHRAILAKDYFCPLPPGDALSEIRHNLKSGDSSYLFQSDE